MPTSLRQRLKPHKEEILAMVRRYGVREAMARHGVRHRPTFMIWLEAQTDEVFPVSPLVGLAGGEKRKFLREHREAILDLLNTHGEEFVKEHYHLKDDTLDTLLRYEPTTYAPKLTKSDRALAKAEIAEQAVEELRKEIGELRQKFATFQEGVSTQLTKKFLIPLLQSIEVNESLIEKPKPDNLSVTNLLAQAKEN